MNKRTLTILILVVAAAIQTSMFLVPLSMIDVYFLIAKPISWIIVFLSAFILFQKNELPHKNKENISLIIGLGTVIYLILLFAAGYFLKFNTNPMDLSLKGLTNNIWTYFPIIVIREYVRNKIMLATTNKNKVYIGIAVTLVFTYTSIDNLRSLVNFSLTSKFEYFITILLPLLLTQAFLTFTAKNGAMGSNIAYQLVPTSLMVFLPYLPNTSKILEAIIIYVVLFIMYVIYSKMAWEQKRNVDIHVPRYSQKWMIIPAGILVILILFGMGAFPWVPVTVVSNSMKDEFSKGDIVFVEKLKDEEKHDLEEGEIIQFRQGKITIAHRIIDTYVNPQGERLYITKGDNNEIVDIYPVKAEQVIGKIELSAKYMGWPALILTNFK